MFPFTGILQDIAGGRQHIYLTRPFHLVDGPGQCAKVLALLLFLLLRVVLFQCPAILHFPSRLMESQD